MSSIDKFQFMQLQKENENLKDQLQKSQEQHQKAMISIGIDLVKTQDKHDSMLNQLLMAIEVIKDLMNQGLIQHKHKMAQDFLEQIKTLSGEVK
jgi:hypothetical protein